MGIKRPYTTFLNGYPRELGYCLYQTGYRHDEPPAKKRASSDDNEYDSDRDSDSDGWSIWTPPSSTVPSRRSSSASGAVVSRRGSSAVSRDQEGNNRVATFRRLSLASTGGWVVELIKLVGWTHLRVTKGRNEQEKEEREEKREGPKAEVEDEIEDEVKEVSKGEVKEGPKEEVAEQDEEEETPSAVWDDAYDARLRARMMPWLLFLLVLHVVKYACGLW